MSSTIESDRAAKKLQQFFPWRSLSFECVNGLTSESHRAGDEMWATCCEAGMGGRGRRRCKGGWGMWMNEQWELWERETWMTASINKQTTGGTDEWMSERINKPPQELTCHRCVYIAHLGSHIPTIIQDIFTELLNKPLTFYLTKIHLFFNPHSRRQTKWGGDPIANIQDTGEEEAAEAAADDTD